MNLIHPLYKLQRGLWNEDRSLMDDQTAEWFLEQESHWRATTPHWSHAQARAAFGLPHPLAEGIRGVNSSTKKI